MDLEKGVVEVKLNPMGHLAHEVHLHGVIVRRPHGLPYVESGELRIVKGKRIAVAASRERGIEVNRASGGVGERARNTEFKFQKARGFVQAISTEKVVNCDDRNVCGTVAARTGLVGITRSHRLQKVGPILCDVGRHHRGVEADLLKRQCGKFWRAP